ARMGCPAATRPTMGISATLDSSYEKSLCDMGSRVVWGRSMPRESLGERAMKFFFTRAARMLRTPLVEEMWNRKPISRKVGGRLVCSIRSLMNSNTSRCLGVKALRSFLTRASKIASTFPEYTAQIVRCQDGQYKVL